MNVIFLDFDGVLHGAHDYTVDDKKQVYKRMCILSNIVKEYNCKVVIESSIKDAIDEDTLKTDVEWINEYLEMFKELGIEVIGRTPNCEKRLTSNSITSIWKENEIISYLKNHPEIEHFCIIDDDDLKLMNRESDLDKVRDYLVAPLYSSKTKNPDEEGLLESHATLVGNVLKKDNRFKR